MTEKWTEKLADKAVDGVYVDTNNGVAGTVWPIGTPSMPVSNLTDLIAIAAARNTTTIRFVEPAGMVSLPVDMEGYWFIGAGKGNNDFDLNGKSVYQSIFKDCWILGTGTGLFWVVDCHLAQPTVGDINCHNSYFHGQTTLTGDAYISNARFQGGAALKISNGGLGKNINLVGLSGDMSLRAVAPGGDYIYIYGCGLKLNIEATWTVGDIFVYGDVQMIDNSAGADVYDHTNKPRAETPVSINAIAASETNFLNLATAGFRYTIDDLVLKCVDPGANTVNVKLYKLVNGSLTNVQTFAITTANFGTYYDINTMFGLKSLAGHNIKITVRATAGGPYAVTGSYAYRSA